ncbi:hypothetical protein RR46_08702 [Papilio xuthus]|uniref:Uncharacterized protein n=1 Tax=Papilio xuthus TaxID=66420 RepID=A0A194Q9I6_PAPXU|nr:hypothetical protein RR46_08702 [Papilio xuthus]
MSQVGAQCVVGWSGEAVERLCARTAAAAPAGELPLRLRRRGAARLARTPPLHAPRRARRRLPPAADLLAHRYELKVPVMSGGEERGRGAEGAEAGGQGGAAEAGEGRGGAERTGASSSEESEPLSPPASPTHLHLDGARYCRFGDEDRSLAISAARCKRAGFRSQDVRGAAAGSGAAPAQRQRRQPARTPASPRPAPDLIDPGSYDLVPGINASSEAMNRIEPSVGCQLWQELQQRRCERGHSPPPEDALYRRDKELQAQLSRVVPDVIYGELRDPKRDLKRGAHGSRTHLL